MLKQPPNVNGIMQLTEEQILAIQAKLQAIQSAFEPTDEQPVCDTFYITATYNRENVGSECNGDTVEYILAYVKEETPSEQEV
jgi:hypothetical protein